MATSRFISLRWRMLALVLLILLLMSVAATWVARSTYLKVMEQQQASQLQQALNDWQKRIAAQQSELSLVTEQQAAALLEHEDMTSLTKLLAANKLSNIVLKRPDLSLLVWPEQPSLRKQAERILSELSKTGVGLLQIDNNLLHCAYDKREVVACQRVEMSDVTNSAQVLVQQDLWVLQGAVLQQLQDSSLILDATVLQQPLIDGQYSQQLWQAVPQLGRDVTLYWHGRFDGAPLRDQASHLVNKIMTIFLLVLMISVLMVISHSRGLIKPLLALQRFAKAVGRGESIKLHDKFRNDEVGQLYQQMFAMKHALTERHHHLHFQATHDGLTGLVNRFAAGQQLETSLLSQPLCLLQFRIQSFKDINDSLGFASGDEILHQLARRMKEMHPAPLLAARFDSVEFLLAFNDAATDEQLQSILQALSQNYTLVQSKLQLRLVAGFLQLPIGADISHGLRHLSIATQQAQREGVSLVRYHDALDEAHSRQLSLIRDLPVTSNTDEFFVLYQPVVRLRDGKCLGAEALIRWKHPRLGIVSPVEFIPIAEYAGCIHVITQWLVNTVASDISRWQRLGLPLKVGVNLSVHDVLDSDLPQRLAQALVHHQVEPELLVLEVREDVVMHMPERSMQTLQQLHQQGSLLTLDNFGKGQSSLAFLKTLPLQQLKIDRHFITNLCQDQTDQLIVRTTIELAHAMGQIVIAEGVEDAATEVLLKQLKCDLVQGYFYAKPLPAAEFIRWVQQRQHEPLTAGL